jgi:hypothetical protein
MRLDFPDSLKSLLKISAATLTSDCHLAFSQKH